MGCSCINEETKSRFDTETEGKKLNKNEDKKMVINGSKKVTVYKNYKKETQKGLTDLKTLKKFYQKI